MRDIRGRLWCVRWAALLVLSGCGDNEHVDEATGDAGSTPTAIEVALTVNVVGPAGESVPGFRWLLERDLTYRVSPGVADPATLAVRFHRSSMPVVQSGLA